VILFAINSGHRLLPHDEFRALYCYPENSVSLVAGATFFEFPVRCTSRFKAVNRVLVPLEPNVAKEHFNIRVMRRRLWSLPMLALLERQFEAIEVQHHCKAFYNSGS
jgi:hypothetical protein